MCPWFVSSSIIPSIFRYFCEENFLNRSACFWFLLPYAFTSSVAGCCCWWCVFGSAITCSSSYQGFWIFFPLISMKLYEFIYFSYFIFNTVFSATGHWFFLSIRSRVELKKFAIDCSGIFTVSLIWFIVNMLFWFPWWTSKCFE